MNVATFTQMVENFQRRLRELYQDANTLIQQSDSRLAPIYKELGMAAEELQVTLEELVIRTEELAGIKVQLETERQHYQDLFKFLPDAYVVSDSQGKILQANQAAASLLNLELRFLIGKPLEIFLSSEERRDFPAKLSKLHQFGHIQKWTSLLQPRNREPLNTILTVVPSSNSEGKPSIIYWSFQNINEDKQIQVNQKSNSNSFDLSQDCPKYIYRKGEIIPLEHSNIWLICRGLVKLSTINENGEEVLVGLARPSWPFGSSMTCLPAYQATALSQEVELISISLAQIANCSQLRDTLFSKTIERMRQTEFFLSISTQRKIQDRLNYILMWLKNNFGQKVADGIRLNIRLTHQELAALCCTTRVTITRLLGELRKQEKIKYDSHHHIVFLDES